MNYRKTTISSLLLAVMLASGSAGAEEEYWYMSFAVGDAQDSVLDASDTGWKLAAGSYFSRYLGAEVALVSLGAPENGGIEFEQGGIGLFALGRLPVGKRFDLFAKAGWFAWNVTASGQGFVGEEDGSDLAWGIGAGFNFTENFRVELQHERFTEILESDVDMLSLSAVLRFE